MLKELEYRKNLGEAFRFILDSIVRNENGVHSPYEIPLFDKDMNKKNAIWNFSYETYRELVSIYNILEPFNNYKKLDVMVAKKENK